MKKLTPTLIGFLIFVVITTFIPFAGVPIAKAATLVSITVTPENGEIPALGLSENYTATANYDDNTTADVTGTATWAIFDPSIASNDGGGAFKAKAEGWTWVTATFGGAVAWAGLNVWRPGLNVSVGLPGETTGFDIWASGCNGLSWALDVAGPTTYSASGTIGSDEWSSFSNSVLSEGNYIATYSVGGAVQQTWNFTVWPHTAWMDVNPGYSGEVTNITLNATGANGAAVKFVIDKYDWGQIDWKDTNVVGDPWSLTYTYTLEKGTYWAYFFLNGRWEDGKEFSVVDRGVPQPPVEEKPKPKPETYGWTDTTLISNPSLIKDTLVGKKAKITLDSAAIASLGGVKVQFFVDGKIKKTDKKAPFNYNLKVKSGTHTLTIKIFDSKGNLLAQIENTYTK